MNRLRFKISQASSLLKRLLTGWKPVSLCLLFAGVPLFGANLIPADQQAFADGLYRRGLHEMALKEYQLLLQEHPEYEKADAVLFRMAESYRHMGNIPAARRYYARLAMTLKDSDFRERADFRRAELDIREEKFSEAVKQFDRFLEEASDPALASAARYYRGMALRKLGRNAEAEEALRTLVKDEPDSAYHAYALLELATLLSGQDSGGEEALRLFEEARGAAGADRLKAESLFQQAALAYRLKRYEESSEFFRRLLETHPEDYRAGEALYQAAWAAWEAGQYERVLAWCAEAPEGAAEQRAAWLHMEARSHRALGQAEKAAPVYDRLLKEFGDYSERTEVFRERAYLAYEQAAYARAAECILALGDRADPEDRWLLAEAYRAGDQPALARPVFEALGREAGYSNAVQAAYIAADLAWRQGDGGKAAEAFEEIAAKNPEDKQAADALYASGVIRRELLQGDRARENWIAFLEKAPDHARAADALYQLAVVEHEAGLKEEAEAHYKAYIERWPKGPFAASVWHRRAILAAERGQAALEETCLREAISASEDTALIEQYRMRLAALYLQQERWGEGADMLQTLLANVSVFEPAQLEWLAGYRLQEEQYDKAEAAAAALVLREETDWRQIG